jgi:hypothetical protein
VYGNQKTTLMRLAQSPKAQTTEEIRYELGNFEKELVEAIRAEPGFDLGHKYGYGSISDGELKMMVRYQAITLHDLPYWHTRVCPQQVRWWMEKMRLVREVRDRRHYAQQKAQEAVA